MNTRSFARGVITPKDSAAMWPRRSARMARPVRESRKLTANSADRPILSRSTIQNGGTPGMNGTAAIAAAKIRMGQRSLIASVLLFFDRGRGERTEQQHGDQQHEDDHLLVVGGVERGEGLDDAD